VTVKRAHMITRAYLASWANERGHVHVWDGENEISRPQPLANATVVNYAYRPLVTNFDLEADYARIENRGIPALRSLATGGAPNREGRDALVTFLDMHLERGRYADQAKVRVPAAMGSTTAPVQMVDMALGDRLTFARDVDTDAVRLRRLDLEKWRWRVHHVESGLVTGDGAVLLFRARSGEGVGAVTFPLSPSRLLVIGDALDGLSFPINLLIANACRRWLIDQVDGAMARAASFR